MRLAFWRRESAPEFDHAAWVAGRLAEAHGFADEMASWPEPIDVIRTAMGLPLRWQVAVARGWRSVLDTITYDPTSALFASSGALLSNTYRASAGMLPIHYEALENAKRPRR